MNERYNQPTAHMLQPVKGWDSMAHLDFVAPIATTVDNALPGTVMHLNSFGQLEPGLTAQGMGMYLFYKMNDEDVQPYPLTADGTRMTAVGMQSFGGYNSEVYLRGMEGNPYDTNGHASNVGAYKFDVEVGQEPYAKVRASQSAHTTYPAICGMELSSTEFAAQLGDFGTTLIYNPNDCLTSPAPAAYSSAKPGTKAQQTAGGFLKKGTCYVDPICGIVSKKPVINEHGYKQICFWSTWLPALAEPTADLKAGATIKVSGKDGSFKLNWDDASDSTTVDFYSVFRVDTSADAKEWTPITADPAAATHSTTADNVYYVRFSETNAGVALSNVMFSAVNGSTAVEIGAAAKNGVEIKRLNEYPATFQIKVAKDATIAGSTPWLTFTAAYGELTSKVVIK